jgi:hypothetical protein
MDDEYVPKVGDLVLITDLGEVYSTFSTLFDMISDPLISSKKEFFLEELEPSVSRVYKVLYIRAHPRTSNMLAIIEDIFTDQVYIMGCSGLELYDYEKFKE